VADIFVSYAREDEDRVRVLVTALKAEGWSVFWDRRVPAGKTWRDHIGQALTSARCVLVVWSKSSVKSSFVTEEADDGKERGILIPVLLDAVVPPLGFRNIHAADLSASFLNTESEQFEELCAGIGALAPAAPQEVATPARDTAVAVAQPGSPVRRVGPLRVAGVIAVIAVIALTVVYGYRLISDRYAAGRVATPTSLPSGPGNDESATEPAAPAKSESPKPAWTVLRYDIFWCDGNASAARSSAEELSRALKSAGVADIRIRAYDGAFRARAESEGFASGLYAAAAIRYYGTVEQQAAEQAKAFLLESSRTDLVLEEVSSKSPTPGILSIFTCPGFGAAR
jgi:hypothetical protein